VKIAVLKAGLASRIVVTDRRGRRRRKPVTMDAPSNRLADLVQSGGRRARRPLEAGT
jgi:hypothetical protein